MLLIVNICISICGHFIARVHNLQNQSIFSIFYLHKFKCYISTRVVSETALKFLKSHLFCDINHFVIIRVHNLENQSIFSILFLHKFMCYISTRVVSETALKFLKSHLFCDIKHFVIIYAAILTY